MKVNIKRIVGMWKLGYALDKHIISSVYMGDNAHGRTQFNTTRTEVGEALYQLKYRRDSGQAAALAEAVCDNLCPRFGAVQLVIPMPASKGRIRQPVYDVAQHLANLLGVHSFERLLLRRPGGAPLKDLHTRAEKDQALRGRISVVDGIDGSGPYAALLLDDLYDTGASLNAACVALRSYAKIGDIYVAALTWK